MPSRPATSKHLQQGAIGLWGVMTLLLAVMFLALAVDTGRLWMQQRKLQSIADIASMEAARTMGCSIDLSNAIAAAQAAAERNGYTGQLSQNPNVVELGSIATLGGVREFFPETPHEAVRVYATQSVPASLVAGGLFGNQVVLHAEAVSAADPPLVAFTAGTYLASISTDVTPMNRLLGEMLGTNLNLTALSYEGLAT
ncbi:MAG TPA: TadG family pilus assembly protein, partial [Methylophilaceae bacterium]|nr:TadG family pilus assembly protein [Methylophilaceae bacterium]